MSKKRDVRRWIMTHRKSVFTKRMTRGRLKRFRETLGYLRQPERELAVAMGLDRGHLVRNTNTGRLAVV